MQREAFLLTVQKVKDLLEAAYGSPRHQNRDDVVDEIVFILLSQMTHEKGYLRTFQALKSRYAQWHETMTADPGEVAVVIRAGGLGDIKAKRLQMVLYRIGEDFGTFDLSFMRDWETSRVRDYLVSLPGVGEKSALCVMMYSLGMPMFPVDVNIRRLFARLGLIPGGWTHRKAQAYLEKTIPGEWGYSLHTNGLAHGRAVCRSARPLCSLCVLGDCCVHACRREEKVRVVG